MSNLARISVRDLTQFWGRKNSDQSLGNTTYYVSELRFYERCPEETGDCVDMCNSSYSYWSFLLFSIWSSHRRAIGSSSSRQKVFPVLSTRPKTKSCSLVDCKLTLLQSRECITFSIYCIFNNFTLYRQIQTNRLCSALPGSDPGFSVHLQSSTPEAMLLWSWWEESSLCSQLLCYSSDMVGFKSTAATNVANSSIVSLSGVFMDVPAGNCSGLQCWKESKILKSRHFIRSVMLQQCSYPTHMGCLKRWQHLRRHTYFAW